MSEQNNSKFFITGRNGGYYEGSIQLPSGTKYSGRVYANEGKDGGTWYRGDLTAQEPARFNQDARIDANARPAALGEQSTLKPLELRLNTWQGGKATHIGNLWTSEGVFTVFANEGTFKGQPTLAGSIKPHQPKEAQPEPKPDGDAAREGIAARAAASIKPPANEKA